MLRLSPIRGAKTRNGVVGKAIADPIPDKNTWGSLNPYKSFLLKQKKRNLDYIQTLIFFLEFGMMHWADMGHNAC
ncbi:MAG: hypothetical protein AAGD25_12125 [Cyanobacteria bacterium P01_F01_bin.150]